MTNHLVREIVEVARELELQETVTSLVFATLTFSPNRDPVKWSIRFPDKATAENHSSLASALRALARNGYPVDADKVNEWLRYTETKTSDSRSRMIFSKSTLQK